LLGEVLDFGTLGGAALIIWGNYLALGKTRQPPIESEPPDEMPNDGGEGASAASKTASR
jgi:hypothetical protein